MTDGADLAAEISEMAGPVVMGKLKKLLEVRRERHRDLLEDEENEMARGRAKECRDLLELFP